jgi:myo-inositol-1(or 4)-monophosphatase
MNKHTDSLIDAVTRAGKYLADNFSGAKDQTLKEGTHYTTKDDGVADLIYSKVLSETNIPICSEEFMLKTLPETYWLIDPIEGTTNYAHGTPFYATQACLIDKNEVVIAAVYAPTLDQFFFAEKGKGATLNNLPIKVGKIDSLSQAIISPNKGTGIENLQKWGRLVTTFSTKVRTVRLFGAVGLELAYVAAGFLDLHLNSGCHAYDDAPGSLIVKEAGGVAQNFLGKDWQIQDRTIIAGNQKLTEEAIALIGQ